MTARNGEAETSRDSRWRDLFRWSIFVERAEGGILAVALGLALAATLGTLVVSLWAPDRCVTGVRVPILFTYESSLRPRETRFWLLDLFVISLFAYRSEEAESEISFLSLFRFRSGYGELIEEGEEDGNE